MGAGVMKHTENSQILSVEISVALRSNGCRINTKHDAQRIYHVRLNFAMRRRIYVVRKPKIGKVLKRYFVVLKMKDSNQAQVGCNLE